MTADAERRRRLLQVVAAVSAKCAADWHVEAALQGFYPGVTRDDVHADFVWMEQRGLLVVMPVGEGVAVTLLPYGKAVALGTERQPGVAAARAVERGPGCPSMAEYHDAHRAAEREEPPARMDLGAGVTMTVCRPGRIRPETLDALADAGRALVRATGRPAGPRPDAPRCAPRRAGALVSVNVITNRRLAVIRTWAGNYKVVVVGETGRGALRKLTVDQPPKGFRTPAAAWQFLDSLNRRVEFRGFHESRGSAACKHRPGGRPADMFVTRHGETDDLPLGDAL